MHIFNYMYILYGCVLSAQFSHIEVMMMMMMMMMVITDAELQTIIATNVMT